MSTTKQSAGLFPKAVLASIGAAAATLEWTRTFLARAIERGEMAEMEAREAIEYPESGQPANAPAKAQAAKPEPMPAAAQPAPGGRASGYAPRGARALDRHPVRPLRVEPAARPARRAGHGAGTATG